MWKVLLVDDDALVRKVFRTFYGWEENHMAIIAEASNGKRALELFSQDHPQIVVTDLKMPVLDGLELTERLMRLDSRTVVVVLSAYDDFGMVKSAFRLGAVDYILKTDMNAEAVTDALNRAKQLAQERFEQAGRSGTEKDDWDFSSRIHQAAIYKIRLNLKTADEKTLGMITQAISQALSLDGAVSVRNEPSGDWTAIVRCGEQGVSIHHDVLKSGFDRLIKRLQGLAEADVFCGVAYCRFEAPQMKRLYQQAEEALRYACFCQNGGFAIYSEPSLLPPPSHDLLDRLGSADCMTQLLEKDFSERLLRSCVPQDMHHLPDTQQLYRQYALRLYELAEKAGLQTELESSINELDTAGCVPMAQNALRTILACIADHMQDLRPLVKDVRSYLQRHLCEQLSLSQVANRFHVTAEHLSRQFTAEMNISFTKYYNKLRMDQAKDWMLRDGLRAVEAADRLGFNNVQYFYRLFKQIEGYPPSHFVSRSVKIGE